MPFISLTQYKNIEWKWEVPSGLDGRVCLQCRRPEFDPNEIIWGVFYVSTVRVAVTGTTVNT